MSPRTAFICEAGSRAVLARAPFASCLIEHEWARAATDIVARIDRAVADARRAKDMQHRSFAPGLIASHGPVAELVPTQAGQMQRWEAPIKALGFKVE